MMPALSRWRNLPQYKSFWIVSIWGIFMATGIGNSYYQSVVKPQSPPVIASGSFAKVGSRTAVFSAPQYEGDWPFPFPTATVQCELRMMGSIRRPVVTIVGNGQQYALNGVARSLGEFPDHKQFMKSDPITGVYLTGQRTVSDLIRAGVALCE